MSQERHNLTFSIKVISRAANRQQLCCASASSGSCKNLEVADKVPVLIYKFENLQHGTQHALNVPTNMLKQEILFLTAVKIIAIMLKQREYTDQDGARMR